MSRTLTTLAAALALAATTPGVRAVDDPAPPPDATPADTAANPELKVPPPVERKVEGLPDPTPGTPAPDPAPEPAPAEPAGGDVVPSPFPLERYAPLWEKSPFHLESVAPPQESAGLAQQFALTGIAQISGEPIVFLLERSTQLRHMLDKKANTAGLSLVQVDVQPKYTESTATIRRGGEVGVVKFDLAAAAVPQPPPAPPPGIMPPGIPGMPQQAAMHGQPQAVPPGVVSSVPGPGVPPTQVVPGQPGANIPPPRVIRRRANVPSAP